MDKKIKNTICLSGLKPERVWHYFGEITQIPHGSGNTKEISDYCVEFAKKHQLFYLQDESHNIIIKKPASPGAEQAPVTMLQGHLDMVCEQEKDSDLDMKKDGLKLYVEGDYISAEKTTLGGDDGIAVAMALAVLEDSELIHPPIEAVFTVDEEIGMLGAASLDKSVLSGTYLLNLDSEQEGSFLCGCAGGAKLTASFPLQEEENERISGEVEESEKLWVSLLVTGCIGGHSGAEIDKERANAIVLLGELLGKINRTIPFDLADLNGGGMDNAIARTAGARLRIRETDFSKLQALCGETTEIWKNEFRRTDGGIEIVLDHEIDQNPEISVYSKERKENLLFFMNVMPNGIEHFSADLPGMVETSLNVGILKTTREAVSFSFCIRSMVETRKEKLCERLQILTEHLGGTISISGSYPGWEFREESELRNCLVKVYEEQYRKQPQILVEHVGVECGMFMDAMEGLDGVSLGPDMEDIHTPRERLSISSVERVYTFLLEVLKQIAQRKSL